MDSTINGSAVLRKEFEPSIAMKVTVNGSLLTPEQNDLILEWEVETVVNRPDMCTITFAMELDGKGQEVKNLPKLPPGAQLEVEVKHAKATGPLFVGEITATTYEHFGGRTTLGVTAYDRRHRLYRGEKSRTFTLQTYGDVVKKLFQEAGMTATVEGLPKILHSFLQQRQCSNGAYLDAILAEVGAVTLSDGATKAKVTTHSQLDGSDPSPVDILEFSAEVTRYSFRSTSDAEHDKVSVRGWNPREKTSFVGDGAELRLAIPAARGCADYRMPIQSTHNALSIDEAKAIANGISARQRASAVQLDAVGMGNPRLKAGKLIEVKNVVKDFEGKYRLTSVRHSLSADGFTTEFSCRGFGDHTMPGVLQQAVLGHEAGLRPSEGPEGVWPAIVSNVKDPQKLGRVKVKFPWLSEGDELDWLRVVTVGAGANRGFFVLPEVNDEVLVAFEGGDLRRGYVLGGLYNGRDKPPGADHVGANGKVDKRIIQTRSGHMLTLNDSDAAPGIELATKSGKLKVTLDDKGTVFKLESGKDVVIDAQGNVTIKSVGNVEIAATGDLKLSGNTVSVEAKTDLVLKGGTNVKVDAGINAEVKANGNAKVSGSAGTEVSSTAITQVKGALVKIN